MGLDKEFAEWVFSEEPRLNREREIKGREKKLKIEQLKRNEKQ